MKGSVALSLLTLCLVVFWFCGGVESDCVINKNAIDGEVETIDWFGTGGQTVFLVTDQYTLYRSINEGQVFNNELSKMANSTKKFYPYYASGVRAVYPTQDPKKIWILGFGPALWTTEDGGNTYKYTDTGLIIHRLSIHPRFTDVALAGAWTAKCYDRNAPGTCVHELYVTFDFGKSWSLVDTYINQWDWGMASTATSNRQSSVFYTAFPSKTGQQFLKSTYDLALYHTTRYGSDKVILQQHSVAMVYMPAPDDILWVATYEPKHRSLNLYVSQDDGQTLTDTDFPEQLVEKRYNILDASEKSAFINVDHSADGSWGKLYMSNDVDERYTTSLDKQRRDAIYVDFEKVWGLDGVYITNYYDDASDRPSSDRIRTKITYDKGAEWTFIPPPAEETCTDCFLNLFGLVDTIYGRVYSDPGSAGLILATGNVGKYLKKMTDDVNTYFSRDAGWSWRKIGDGSLTYEFGDHGGIIVTAPYDQKTTTIRYSWDQGITWVTCNLPNQIAVTNIVVEPMGASQNFLIYGTNPVDSSGLVFFLNLTSLHQRDCVGSDKPNTAGSDYETWSPSDALDRDCLMGATTVITRRKQTAQCFNRLATEQMKQTTICPCADEDYECDYCYEEGSGNTCTLACSNFDPNAQPQPCKDYYYTATGYRIVAGDVCDPSKGVNKLGEKRRCDPNYVYPSSSSSSDSYSSSHSPKHPHKESPGAIIGVLLLIFVVIFGVGITTVMYLHRHNERFRGIARAYLPRWFSDQHHSYRQLAMGGESVLDEDYGSDAELLDEEELSTLHDKSDEENNNNVSSGGSHQQQQQQPHDDHHQTSSSFVAFPTPSDHESNNNNNNNNSNLLDL
eukprot:TRINITY_DN1135_c0_g1_i5.p1 TRINITY_DN1135_c0_g1~~TRINITY_DN1135_c0_g1_i5.p1  ORF type:complete len:845 (-),score=131.32 TRINITY_DN1135_c0_g1_i5:147-2681(-)